MGLRNLALGNTILIRLSLRRNSMRNWHRKFILGNRTPGPGPVYSHVAIISAKYSFLPKQLLWIICYRVFLSDYDWLFPRPYPRWFISTIIHAICIYFRFCLQATAAFTKASGLPLTVSIGKPASTYGMVKYKA
jgi:hypothetical protein